MADRPPADRLLVVRLGSLGDLVHTLPAVAALHRSWPAMEIDWLVDRVHRELLDLVPVLSQIVVLAEPTMAGWLDARRRMRARSYGVAVDFQGLLKSAALARLSGARRVVGFDRAALREPSAAWLYSDRIAIGGVPHVIDKNLALAAALGAVAGPRELPLAPVTSAVAATLEAQGLGRFALINGGAAWPNKRWPAERFGRLARWLRDAHGLSSVAIWGPGEDALAADIARESDGAAIVAPPTSLHDLVALSRMAALMVSGDTGPTHIAAAVGTPIVALFGPTDPARNGPWQADDGVISRYGGCLCHYQRRCHHPERWCLVEIDEGDVRRAIDERLSRPAAC
jgi:lipopolysaccharide heptosyltransferase I